MISKKAGSETMPTSYNDKNEFENSSDNFSFLSKAASTVTTKSIRFDANALKSTNYFGYNFASNRNLSASSKNTAASSIKQNYQNKNSYGLYPQNQHTEQYPQYQLPANKPDKSFINAEYEKPSQLINIKKQQAAFQKYILERHVNHFNHRTSGDSTTKYMISKILNGDIENTANISDKSAQNNSINKSLNLIVS